MHIKGVYTYVTVLHGFILACHDVIDQGNATSNFLCDYIMSFHSNEVYLCVLAL